MVLSGQEIRAQLGSNIIIDPFDESKLNPNSYNLTLHNELMVYEEVILDMRKPSRVRRITIPEEGLVLQPDQLYLARTAERTETHNLVPMIEGRSSVGRLGLFVHVTAGFGDVGFCGYWTLEMFAVQSVRIYPGVPICQRIVLVKTTWGTADVLFRVAPKCDSSSPCYLDRLDLAVVRQRLNLSTPQGHRMATSPVSLSLFPERPPESLVQVCPVRDLVFPYERRTYRLSFCRLFPRVPVLWKR